jgi:hypothetical protein
LLAEPLDAARPRQLTGAIVFNVAIDTDFPGHVRLDGTTLVVRIPDTLPVSWRS